jgi:hypothetical protein
MLLRTITLVTAVLPPVLVEALADGATIAPDVSSVTAAADPARASRPLGFLLIIRLLFPCVM